VMQTALEHIAATPRDWDVIDLRYIDQLAPEYLAIGAALRGVASRYFVRPRMEVRFCTMEMGWKAYAETRSRNWRRQMRRDIEMLEEHGTIELMRYRPAAGGTGRDARTLEVYEICERIAANSWQAEADSQSTLCSPRVRDLLLELHCRAAALGMLDANILTVGRRPVAFNYNYVAEGRTYGLRAGFDQTAGLEHCGRILLYKMLEDSFARGDAEYCFGPGRQAYKDRFATEMRYAYTFRSYARTSLKSRLLQWRESMRERIASPQAVIDRELVS
jgi:CelD/BcsL family acetyltransferase involved in cellulose biosynthesis